MATLDHDADQSLVLAAMALKKNQPQRTVALCEQYLITSPSSIDHLQLLTHALVKLGQLDQASERIRFALSINPDFAPLHEDLGSILALQQNFDPAIESFRRAVAIDPRLASAHKKLAQALVAADRSDEVDDAFENYLDHNSEAAMVAEGAEHWRSARLPEAETVLKKTLRKYSNNVDAMRFLAMVYHGQNIKLSDAEALLRRATSIAPDFHQAYNNLGKVLLDNGKWQDAVDCYKTLVQLKPDEDSAWAGLGRAYSHTGEVENASRAFEKSLSLNDQSPSVNLAYAHTLKTIGRQGDALAAYRNAIKFKPGLGESYWSMANLKIFQFEDEEVVAMEQQLKGGELSDSGKVHFEFALGKAYEDQKNYDQAWQHYHQGNQIQRRLVDYDAVENELQLQAIREEFSAEFLAANNGSGHSAADPIFIVGLPRSGSTLIEQILASHSQVEGTSELPNMGNIAVSTGKFRHDGLIYPHTMSTLTGRDFAAYGKEYLQQIAHHRIQGTPFFIDKMPNNFAHVGWIKLILPNAKIINTRRHPIDSCLGAYKQLFAKGQHFTYDMFELAEFYRSYVEIMTHWHSVLPGQILDVHYEDTVTNLEAQVRKILSFCQLEFEPQLSLIHI